MLEKNLPAHRHKGGGRERWRKHGHSKEVTQRRPRSQKDVLQADFVHMLTSKNWSILKLCGKLSTQFM